MRRALALICPLLAVLAVAVAPAGAAGSRHALYFQVHEDGFWVGVRSPLGSERVRLSLDRRGQVAYYWAPAKIGDDTVRARFGKLGALAVRFTPDRKEGPLGCGRDGAQDGTFRGALVFHGENHYAHIDARRARGWMQTRPSHCEGGPSASAGEGEVRRATASAAPVAETGAVLEATTANVLPADVFYTFLDHGPKGVRVAFGALREERREGMRIERGAQIYGGSAGFQWDLGAGTALLAPPGPFEGRAAYKRGEDGKASWTGSLRVPLLGSPRPMRLAGSAFSAHLRAGT
jgi:hypothetical protein